ncbi:MAG: trigger factor [Actinomycetota bacterium]
MPSTIEETGQHRVRLTVEVPADQFAQDLDKTYRRVSGQIKVPGFRKGHIPRKIIDAQLGPGAVLREYLEDAVPIYYRQAIREQDLAPIAEPEIEVEKAEEGQTLVFTADVEIRPRLDLQNYKGVKVDRPSNEVSDADVEEYLDRLRDRFAELEVVGHPARRGDFVVADIHASVHDKEIPEASRQEYLYEVGSQELVPELDQELEGKRKGEILQFNAKLSGTFAPEVADQEVSFRVLVKEIKAKKLPAADDEFAKTSSEFDTIDELRADVREKLGELKERQVDAELRELVLQQLVDRVVVELPERLVDHEIEHRVEQAKERAERIGMTLEQVLEAQGWDELRLRSDARAHAVRALEADLVLEAVARQEGLQVTAEELSDRITQLAQAIGRDPKEVAGQLERSGAVGQLAGDIIRSKALDLLVEHAEVVSVDQPLKKESQGAETVSATEPSSEDQGEPRS